MKLTEKERAAIEAQALAARWRREIATTMPAAVAAAEAFADKRLGCCFCRRYDEYASK